MSKPPDPQVAIQGSPLFRLPPEIRTQIYAIILTQSPEVLISRRRVQRSIFTRFIPNHCMHCAQHNAWCICSYIYGSSLYEEFYYPEDRPIPAQTVSAVMLRTCRVIYHEAAPLLYRDNRFHFVDPTAVALFHQIADQRHVPVVERLMLTVHNHARRYAPYKWEDYLFQFAHNLDLGTLFPRLKSVVVRLRGVYEIAPSNILSPICAAVARNLPPLEWLHVDGLTNPTAPIRFRAVIEKQPTGPTDTRVVRTDWTELWYRKGWLNVTIWWGFHGQEPPYRPPWVAWPIAVKQILQGVPLTIVAPHGFIVMEESVPCGTGIGGVQGSFGYL